MHVDQILASPITWIVVAAASEIIALSPLKDNSIVQLVLHIFNTLKAKELIPSDGRWLWRFSTRSEWNNVQRAIQRRKFEATLKPRLDSEIEEWHKSQPPTVPPPIQIDDLHIRAPWHDQQKTDNP